MAGTAFLPWEEWLARLLHPIAIAIKDGYTEHSGGGIWPEAKLGHRQKSPFFEKLGSVIPTGRDRLQLFNRAGVLFRVFWRWFDSSDIRQVFVGDRIVLRYDAERREESVFVRFTR